MASRYTAFAIKMHNFGRQHAKIKPLYLKNKVSNLLISLHHSNGNILVYSDSIFEKNSTTINFLISDKPNIFIVTRLEKFASVQGKIVNIHQIEEANCKVSL